MNFIFHQGKPAAPVLVLLHGTGGDERSLLDLGHDLDPQASLLGIRGNVLENGMPRYFKRLAEGIYDEEDLMFRGQELAAFIQEVAKEKGFSIEQVVLVGYSNGANIALNLLLEFSALFQKAILYHPMYPVSKLPNHLLAQTNVFMSFGLKDPIVSVEDSKYVQEIFESRGVQIEYVWTPSHQLTYQEVEKSRKWYEEMGR